MNTTQKIRYIANHYGFESQSRQLMEECGELAQAVNKMWKVKKRFANVSGKTIKECEAENNLISEMADVSIMISQLQELLGIDNDDIAEEVDFKLDREIERIQKERGNDLSTE